MRVLVASDHALVGDTVRAALATRGHEVGVIRWPTSAHPVPRRRLPRHGAPAEVGLLLCDLDRWSRIHAATTVVTRVSVPWIALTGSPRGPAWGSLLVAGVEVVLPVDLRLEQISDHLLSVALRDGATPLDERTELETAWRELRARRGEVTGRIGMLTPREDEVLHLMYEGSSVARIADTFGVTPATVRTQVKGVLRKLEVNTQLAAVALVDDSLDELEPRARHWWPPPGPGEPPASR